MDYIDDTNEELKPVDRIKQLLVQYSKMKNPEPIIAMQQRADESSSYDPLLASLSKFASSAGSLGGKQAESTLPQTLDSFKKMKQQRVESVRKAMQDRMGGLEGEMKGQQFLAGLDKKPDQPMAWDSRNLDDGKALKYNKMTGQHEIIDYGKGGGNGGSGGGAISEKPMSTTDKQRLDNVIEGLSAVDGMESAMKAGDSPLSLRDNNFTFQRKMFIDALSRMQSGGAINPDEMAMYKSMAPTLIDSDQMRTAKFAELRRKMSSRAKTLGKDPDELLQTYQGQSQGHAGKVKVTNGQETRLVDPSRLHEAIADGYQEVK